jgi:hypothetical protein
MFSCKKSFTASKKGRHPDVDAARDATHMADYASKATETAKSLGITSFKAGQGWCDVHAL